MASLTSLVPTWYPPNREHWELINYCWQFFPIFTAAQWFTTYYPQGKTSTNSRFNLPGKWAWCFMEVPGFLTCLYCMCTIPAHLGLARHPGLESLQSLPIGNKTMAGLYTIHYLYRAIASPLLLNPSMSPIHPLIFISAFSWQVCNGLALGGWLGGYGPTTVMEWSGRLYVIEIGLVIWGWGLLGNMFHDDELREIRREVIREQAAKDKTAAAKSGNQNKNADKVYKLPKNGLFQLILFPHYLFEWVEWAGFWLIGGPACVPARSFLINEIATMLPRAIQGWHWYVEKFGRDRVGSRKAVIPFLI